MTPALRPIHFLHSDLSISCTDTALLWSVSLALMLLLAALSGVTLGLNLLPRTDLRDRNHAGVAAVAASGPEFDARTA